MSTIDEIPNLSDVLKARKCIQQYIERTPLVTCRSIGELCDRNIYFKAENLQKAGSFKSRGAFNSVLNSRNSGKVQSLITHSSGNHGMAIANVGRTLNIPATIVMPESSPSFKRNTVALLGAEVVECEASHSAREEACKRIQRDIGATFVSSSQNHNVIAGQGTVALEMLEDQPDLDAIVVPVGGGGLISGVAIAAKQLKPDIKVYGAEPEIANSCYQSKKNGGMTPLEVYPKTVADGLCTNIGPVTWPIIQNLVDDVIIVSEEEIATATKLIWERAKLVVEPSAGVPLAAVLSENFYNLSGVTDRIKNIGIVLTGGNIQLRSVRAWT